MARVSVITIFLDAEPFIAEAVESVYDQTYDDWELLLVDDGSTDASTEIARRYASARPDRVRYLEHPGHMNLGMSASRNLGLANAGAEYVAFLDADDVWLPVKLEEQVAILDAHPEVAMVFGTEIVWFSWTGRAEDTERDYAWQFTGVATDSVARPGTLIPQFLRYSRAPCPSIVAVRRDAAQRCGGFEDEFRTMNEDEVFYDKISLRQPAFVSTQTWSRRRQHPGQATSKSDQAGRSRAERLTYLVWLERYLMADDARGGAAWEALQEQLQSYRPAQPASPWVRWWEAGARTRRRLGQLVHRVVRRVSGGSTGWLDAQPNPVRIGEAGQARTQLSWRTSRAQAVEVRLGAPDGPLVSRSGPSGSSQTGDWIANGMVFYLQDVSGGKPLSAANTLDRVRVGLLP